MSIYHIELMSRDESSLSLSFNSTTIDIDQSRDSNLDFSICSNPIDEVAIIEENNRENLRNAMNNKNDRITFVAPTTITTNTRMSASSPPLEPPPPPPATFYKSDISNSLAFDKSNKSDMTLKEDFDNHSDIRSRSTVREIPVQRTSLSSTSSQRQQQQQQQSLPAFSSTSTTYDYNSTPWSDNHDYHEEQYYRKEIMTRTYITKSTETLSSLPQTQQTGPLSRSSPIDFHYYQPKDQRFVDYNVKYLRNIEEEERRIKENQERRELEEEERRRRIEEEKYLWEMKQKEFLEKVRAERDKKQRELEYDIMERERFEKERIDRDRSEREKLEMSRREEWEKLEKERRKCEEMELEKKRNSERERLRRLREDEERRERERIERERLEKEREMREKERVEREKAERERVERERIEMERMEIERIERIKRERQEREQIEREKEHEEEERREKERLERERLMKEKEDLRRIEQELIEAQRREDQLRQAERLHEQNREAQRREEERREAELIAEMKRKADERESQRRLHEMLEKERLENVRKEQERLEIEKREFERREQQRLEEERRELELLDAQRRAAEKREKERLEDELKEKLRQEEERREAEKRNWERKEALRRERERQLEEELEKEKLSQIERAAHERRAERLAEMERNEQRLALERKVLELKEIERRENERRDFERMEEKRKLMELRENERKNCEKRERERREALERERKRAEEDRRSRDKLNFIAKEIEEKDKLEMAKRKLLEDYSRKNSLTSKETLEKLIKLPYYSRENLYTPSINDEVTKIERQIIERVDKKCWMIDDTRSTPSPAAAVLPYKEISELSTGNGDNIARKMPSSRYKSKVDRAKKDFFFSHSTNTPDGINERFQDTLSDLHRTRSQLHYPSQYLQRYNSTSSGGAAADIGAKKAMNYSPYGSVGPSPYNKEYEELMDKIQSNLADYQKKRLSQPNLYSRNRTWSTSYLETNLDTGFGDIVCVERQLEETNLDDVHRSRSVMDHNRQSRRDIASDNNSHIRSKSADYLMDKKKREESAPPENALQKFNDKISKVSEHEIRFIKSTEKLHVPDWYRERKPIKITNIDDDYDKEKFALPYGMFDRYKDEINDMRRSRSSLFRNENNLKILGSEDYANESEDFFALADVYNIPENRETKIVELADVVTQTNLSPNGNDNKELTKGVAISSQINKESKFHQNGASENNIMPNHGTKRINMDNQIFNEVYNCSNCFKLKNERQQFSCKYCYKYFYCNEQCRLIHWNVHKNLCDFSRISALCKDIIIKVRNDEKMKYFLSKIAYDKYRFCKRGCINLCFDSIDSANDYLIKNNYNSIDVHYYTIDELVRKNKQKTLINLCQIYDPTDKFIISISIIVEIRGEIQQKLFTTKLKPTAVPVQYRPYHYNEDNHLNAAIPSNL